jgi:hypothetical protein
LGALSSYQPATATTFATVDLSQLSRPPILQEVPPRTSSLAAATATGVPMSVRADSPDSVDELTESIAAIRAVTPPGQERRLSLSGAKFTRDPKLRTPFDRQPDDVERMYNSALQRMSVEQAKDKAIAVYRLYGRDSDIYNRPNGLPVHYTLFFRKVHTSRPMRVAINKDGYVLRRHLMLGSSLLNEEQTQKIFTAAFGS